MSITSVVIVSITFLLHFVELAAPPSSVIDPSSSDDFSKFQDALSQYPKCEERYHAHTSACISESLLRYNLTEIKDPSQSALQCCALWYRFDCLFQRLSGETAACGEIHKELDAGRVAEEARFQKYDCKRDKRCDSEPPTTSSPNDSSPKATATRLNFFIVAFASAVAASFLLAPSSGYCLFI